MTGIRAVPDEITTILKDLSNHDWNIRQGAVRRIGGIRDPEELSVLFHRLQLEKWYIREAAAAGIRVLNLPMLVPALRTMMREGDDILRNAATCALGNMHSREVEAILEQAAGDPDSRVRKNAQISLQRIRARPH